MRLRKITSTLMLTIIFLLMMKGFSAGQPPDLAGHWAGGKIGEWINRGLISGYPDGTFRPDGTITRAEFVTMVNRAFRFSPAAGENYTDVRPTDWYAGETSAARAGGYCSGYQDGTFRPGSPISRQEVASIISRILKLESGRSFFRDGGAIQDWARGAVGSVSSGGIMSGYPDGAFLPERSITRAEAVVVLDSAARWKAAVVYDRSSKYGPDSGRETINGDVRITSTGVLLQNTVINGNLLLAEEIGEGGVILKGVSVSGLTHIRGGGSYSVMLQDCSFREINIAKDRVRVVAQGSTSVDTVKLDSGATLVEEDVSKTGYKTINISGAVPPDAVINLSGYFDLVNMAAPASVKVDTGAIGVLTIDAAARVYGSGKIISANINAPGSYVAQNPANQLVLAPGITAAVGGREVAGPPKEKRKPGPLPRVAKPVLSEKGIVSWEDVSGESGYNLQLYKNGVPWGSFMRLGSGVTSYNLIIDMRAAGPGEYSAAVIARGDGADSPDGEQSERSNTRTVVKLPRLDRPVLSDRGVASWSPVTNAADYDIYLYYKGKEIMLCSWQENSFDLLSKMREFGEGEYRVKVMAKGADLFLDGDPSDLSESRSVVRLQRPGEPSWQGNTLVWRDVPNAGSYEIILTNFGKEVERRKVGQGVQRCDFSDTISAQGGAYKIGMWAKGENLYLDSEMATSGGNVNKITLKRVTMPILTPFGNVQWTGVECEQGYIVKLYRDGTVVEQLDIWTGGVTCDFMMPSLYGAGSYTATVRAKGSQLYSDSPESEPSNVIMVKPLEQVGQPYWNGNYVEWGDISGETGYLLSLRKNGSEIYSLLAPPNSAAWDCSGQTGQFGPGAYTVIVQAQGNEFYARGPVSPESGPLVIE
ncbi:MAG: S-layer homology domain-containing protein [Bacillota bacterium]